MNQKVRVAVAQLAPVVGGFKENLAFIEDAYQRACSQQARLLLTPEMGICGYPPLDWVERPEFIDECEKALQYLKNLTRNQSCALVVGHVGRNPSLLGRPIQNLASVLENGEIVFRQAKTLLPTYDVFDEARYFEPAQETHLWNCDGLKIAIAICEDLWGQQIVLGRRLHEKDPVDDYQAMGCDLVVSISSSPYEFNKRKIREKLHQDIATRLAVPLVYVNQYGATDEILFDGGSFAVDRGGEFLGRLPSFQSSFGVLDVVQDSPSKFALENGSPAQVSDPNDLEILGDGLVVGIREYFNRTGFKRSILGLSGGIDSAVVAALAVKALGSQNVMGVAMPSQYSSGHSLEDAEILARQLKIPLEVRPIKFMYSVAARELAEKRGELAPIALENLQSRLRGLILMTLSNHESALVLTTGNKSELAMGYCTQYGDMAGALAPIGDLFKTQVYDLARSINLRWGGLIPERSITKAPSAELRPNQTDQDTLPPYDLLDQVLGDYIEKGVPVAEIAERYCALLEKNATSVQGILRKLDMNEYKRRQAAPVLKVSAKAFGIGRRVPIAKRSLLY